MSYITRGKGGTFCVLSAFVFYAHLKTEMIRRASVNEKAECWVVTSAKLIRWTMNKVYFVT